MSWSEYKDTWRDEWEFYKRNPEFPLLILASLAGNLYTIFYSQ